MCVSSTSLLRSLLLLKFPAEEIMLSFLARQYLRQNDRRTYHLLCDFHALLDGSDAEKLPAVRMPFSEYRRADHAGVSVFAVLEVSSHQTVPGERAKGLY